MISGFSRVTGGLLTLALTLREFLYLGSVLIASDNEKEPICKLLYVLNYQMIKLYSFE
jgi:hypothetical protein